MTGIDVREAAERQARILYPTLDVDAPEINRSRRLRQKAFKKGAQWVVEQLPSKAELADLLEGVNDDWHHRLLTGQETEALVDEQADAVLALIGEKVSG